MISLLIFLVTAMSVIGSLAPEESERNVTIAKSVEWIAGQEGVSVVKEKNLIYVFSQLEIEKEAGGNQSGGLGNRSNLSAPYASGIVLVVRENASSLVDFAQDADVPISYVLERGEDRDGSYLNKTYFIPQGSFAYCWIDTYRVDGYSLVYYDEDLAVFEYIGGSDFFVAFIVGLVVGAIAFLGQAMIYDKFLLEWLERRTKKKGDQK